MRTEGASAGLSAVVLAAGEGKRMRSGRAKVLHEVSGAALIDHVLAALAPLGAAPVVVVLGHLREQVEAHLAGREVRVAVQDPPCGTGDALARALPLLPEDGEVVVLSGDVPLITPATLSALLALRRTRGAAAALATAELADPASYGRIVRGPAGEVAAIVEARDANEGQLALREVNAGTYAFDIEALRRALPALDPGNAQGEYYLTDVIGIVVRGGGAVVGLPLADPAEMAGVNSRADLAEVCRLANGRAVRALQEGGVTVLDPATTWVEAGCAVGRDTVLEAGVHLRGGCVVGERCLIGAHTVVDGATVRDGATVPPLTHLRGSRAPSA